MLPITRGVKPSPRTQRYRFICRPGSSPSHAERMTPVFPAYTWRMGPMVASISALSRTTSLPYWNASRITSAPKFTEPVVSTSTSLRGSREQERVGSDDGLVISDGILERVLRARFDDVRQTRIAEDLDCPFRPAAEHGDDGHAWRRVHDSVREALRHETGAQNADANGIVLLRHRFQCVIDNKHRQFRSLEQVAEKGRPEVKTEKIKLKR